MDAEGWLTGRMPWTYVLRYLSASELASVSASCRYLADEASAPHLWRELCQSCLTDRGESLEEVADWKGRYRHLAVGLSLDDKEMRVAGATCDFAGESVYQYSMPLREDSRGLLRALSNFGDDDDGEAGSEFELVGLRRGQHVWAAQLCGEFVIAVLARIHPSGAYFDGCWSNSGFFSGPFCCFPMDEMDTQRTHLEATLFDHDPPVPPPDEFRGPCRLWMEDSSLLQLLNPADTIFELRGDKASWPDFDDEEEDNFTYHDCFGLHAQHAPAAWLDICGTYNSVTDQILLVVWGSGEGKYSLLAGFGADRGGDFLIHNGELRMTKWRLLPN